MDPRDDSDDEFEPNYEFCSPAWEETQFKVGEKRGRGRPKGARGEKKIAQELFLERHEVREDGQTKSLTALEIIIKVVRNASLQSDPAHAAVQDLIERHTPQSREPRRILAILLEKTSMEIWEERFEHLRNRD
ncbi:MAG: DUF5681 domain-containing protein [Pseudomonadota bacterium]